MKRPAVASLKRPASESVRQKRRKQEKICLPGKLPVSTLCGFLGAGKTTLLKHILESKCTGDASFRCAVIVNDMAKINIDKSLIDQSALVQSDDVIAMQNGCVCCTLQNDLVSQIIGLAKTKQFHYMIIEASGVSEPSQIAKMFADCEKDHDHTVEHKKEDVLSEFAELDTCVTVVDSADFFNKFHSIRKGPASESFPQLMVEQIEYANVIVLNKTDLVSSDQLIKITAQVSILNTHAKVLASQNSKIDVVEVLHTGLYKADKFVGFQIKEQEEDVWMASCCKESIALGEFACCRSDSSLDSGKSKVILALNRASQASGISRKPRHVDRFGITSFVYQARRPFHPERFEKTFVEKFFVFQEKANEEAESDDEVISKVRAKQSKHNGKKNSAKNDRQKREERREAAAIRKKQKEANSKHQLRVTEFGDLFRSKGFLWLADRHDLVGMVSTANSVMTIEFPETWSVLKPKAYEGTESEVAAARKEWVAPWGDRRQDLVFIGSDLKHKVIQEILDGCLLTDSEMAMGVDAWKATIGDRVLHTALELGDSGDDE